MLVTMYGLKKEIDLSFLTGRELIQVAIGSFQVQFHFDEDVALSVEGDFAISTDTRNSSREYVSRDLRCLSRVLSRILCEDLFP